MRVLLLLIACLATPALAFASADDYLLAVTHDLPPVAREALQRIDGKPRQLLAVRGYLRSGRQLSSRWSWSADEIRAYCRERLAPYKVPAAVEFRSELPKSMVGKVLRRVLVAQHHAGA